MADRASAALALSTVALVPAVYAAALPPLATVRGSGDEAGHLAAAETYAAVVAGALVLGVAGATGSPEAAAAGLVAVVGFAAAYRLARVATP